MQRFVATTAVCLLLICLAAGSVAVAAETAFLGELVPWPMLSTAIPGVPLELSDAPLEESIQGVWPEEAMFGLLGVGIGPDAGVTVAVVERGELPPTLLVDSDNDQDLTNNRWLEFDEQSGVRWYSWFVTVMAEYCDGTTCHQVPYHVSISALFSYVENHYIYYYGGFSHRRGLAIVAEHAYPIAVTSLSSSGLYSDVSRLVVAVDTNGDGTIDTLPYSHEVFGPEELLVLPEGTYEISEASDDGFTLHLERIGDTDPRPVIAREEFAPAFTAETVDGHTVSVPLDRGRVAVLLFLDSISANAGCTACSSSATASIRRIESILGVLQTFASDPVELIVVTKQVPGQDSLLSLPSSSVPTHLIWDPSINLLYRRSIGALIIGPEGRIVAMDEAWATVNRCNGRPKGALQELQAFEIAGVLEGLLW